MAAPPTLPYLHPDCATEGPELRTLLICPESQLAAEFASHLRGYEGVSLVHTCSEMPSRGEIARVARVHAPTLIVVSVEDPDAASAVLESIRPAMPGVPVAALNSSCVPELLLAVMRLGIQEFLFPPFRQDYVGAALERLRDQVKKSADLCEGTNSVFAFMPAKQGAGATTIALNTAVAAASKWGKRVFLGDFDLNGGILRFVLQLNPSSSIVNAGLSLDSPEDAAWSRFMAQAAGIDVLHSGRLQPELRVEPWQLRRLLEQIRRGYDVVCADLSGNFEAYSLEVMRQSQKIFIVTTPELPSLHLAREKIQFLRQMHLWDRVGVILNRTLKKGLSAQDVASIVEVPVTIAFPNDYAAVSKAIENAGPVRPTSELGRYYHDFARSLVGPDAVPVRRAARRFLEFFSIPNADPVS